jgi:hypothetical protein
MSPAQAHSENMRQTFIPLVLRPGRGPAPRAAGAVVVTVGLALLTSACGGSPGGRVAQLGTSTTQRSSPSGGSTYDQASAFARCVRTHGVPLSPDPESNGTFEKSTLSPGQLGVGSSQIASAELACKSLLPTYSATPQPHVAAQALTFSRCMRDQGATNFPDPESNGAIIIPHTMENSPTYLTALQVCIHKYGVPPPPSPSG